MAPDPLPPSSSNNRTPGVCDAVLVQADRDVGPLRLPEIRAEDFVEQFNRIYAGLGMRLDARQSVAPQRPNSSPARKTP